MAYAEAKHRVRSLIEDALALVDDLILGGRIARYRHIRAERGRKAPEWFHVIR